MTNEKETTVTSDIIKEIIAIPTKYKDMDGMTCTDYETISMFRIITVYGCTFIVDKKRFKDLCVGDNINIVLRKIGD